MRAILEEMRNGGHWEIFRSLPPVLHAFYVSLRGFSSSLLCAWAASRDSFPQFGQWKVGGSGRRWEVGGKEEAAE